MQLVTDRAADLSPEQMAAIDIDIHFLPLVLTLDGKDYISGVDIQPENFYQLLEASENMPSTSLPSPGEIEVRYREIADQTGDKDILSVHISDGLSGTFNAARVAAKAVEKDGINVHAVDTRTLAGAEGWQVEAAAHGLMAGWNIEQIREHLAKISRVTNTVYTLPDLKYLINGGRIGHMKGLIASTLGIKPLIGVNYEDGKYEQRGQVRTFKRAVKGIADNIAKTHAPGTKLRVQAQHAIAPDAVESMNAALAEKFEVEFMPTIHIAPVLGAHTGAGLVGCAYAPSDSLPPLPTA